MSSPAVNTHLISIGNKDSNSEFLMQGLMCHRPGSYQQIVVRAKQSAYMPDGTILQIRGVGVWQRSDLLEIKYTKIIMTIAFHRF